MSSYLASFSGGDTTVIKINPGEKILIGRYFEGVESSNGTLVRLRSKVISRKHAQLSNLDSKVNKYFNKLYLQDTKSSGGTFINDKRMAEMGHESEQVEIFPGDVVEFGEDTETGGGLM